MLVALMPSVGATGDEGGPPRLARWLEARKFERERVAALAAAGVADAAAYEEPGLQERMKPRNWKRAPGMRNVFEYQWCEGDRSGLVWK